MITYNITTKKVYYTCTCILPEFTQWDLINSSLEGINTDTGWENIQRETHNFGHFRLQLWSYLNAEQDPDHSK